MEAKNPARDELTACSEKERRPSTVAKSLLNLLSIRPEYIQAMSHEPLNEKRSLP
jgi:hypothetical protein